MDGHHTVLTINGYFLVVRTDHAFSGNILMTGRQAAHQFERVTISAGELWNEQTGTFRDFVAVIVCEQETDNSGLETIIPCSVNGDQSAFCSFSYFAGNQAGYFRVARQCVIEIRGAEAIEAIQIGAARAVLFNQHAANIRKLCIHVRAC